MTLRYSIWIMSLPRSHAVCRSATISVDIKLSDEEDDFSLSWPTWESRVVDATCDGALLMY